MENIKVDIGENITLGEGLPVVVQSMTNTSTLDVEATVAQVQRLANVGCEMVRITVPSMREIDALAAIRNRVAKEIPLVADVHYLPEVALRCAEIVEKVRINPGNYVDRPTDVGGNTDLRQRIAERLQPLTDICKKHNTAIRIGVNQGSISARLKAAFPFMVDALVASAIEFVDVCEMLNFDQLVLSIKSSEVRTLVDAVSGLHALMCERGKVYPLHLGVTEAGNGQDGRILSAVGIGSLLLKGIGSTIRVSLTEKPENEIPVARAILQACGRGNFTTRFVACPSCGRTQYDIESVLNKIKERFSGYPDIKIAVMGCVVNGPGEMGDADYGYIGGAKGLVNLYRKGELVKANIAEADAFDELEKLIKG
ncbi:MAG: (E)-4-hydroxy-3-methylbut-2-enyl-diphosphate synthase [Bacteroidales bacterium]|nr:(E)-4-hydroxy-3-methylbut-2-enyl-diphosphate synthase [Bacteroidales bacterium]